jgi:hypothetical protein
MTAAICVGLLLPCAYIAALVGLVLDEWTGRTT